MASRLLLSPPIIDKMIREEKFHTYGFCTDPPREAPAANKATRAPNCRRCRRKAKRRASRAQRPIDYNAFKRCVVALDVPNREAVKKLLGTGTLKVRYRDVKGRPQTRFL